MNYGGIDNPYDSHMNRSPGGTSPLTFDPTYAGETGLQTPVGAVEDKRVATGQSMEDIWIASFIRSRDWKPRSQGFNIDGRSGFAEFSGLLARGQLEASGGMTAAIKTVYGSYDVTSQDFTILVDASSAAPTITLPQAREFVGKIIYIKKIDSSGNAVTVTSLSQIDGAGSVSLSAQYQRTQVQSDGVAWYILN